MLGPVSLDKESCLLLATYKINRVSPLHTNEFCSKSAFISPVCYKSNKVSLGTQITQLAI